MGIAEVPDGDVQQPLRMAGFASVAEIAVFRHDDPILDVGQVVISESDESPDRGRSLTCIAS
jgi:hypothetical protein